MVTPFHRVNVLTGVKSAIILDNASEYAALIKQAERPLLVLGPKLLEESLSGRLLLEWALEIAKAASLRIGPDGFDFPCFDGSQRTLYSRLVIDWMDIGK